MNLEMVPSIGGALIVGGAFAMRLNALKMSRDSLSPWQVVEVFGAVGALCGCAGSVGEWFMPGTGVHAETIILAGTAMWVMGFTRGRLCQLAARLQGWDGVTERRAEHR